MATFKLNARQKAFVALSKMFYELNRAVPGDRDLTSEEVEKGGTLAKDVFTAIMDQYDADRKTERIYKLLKPASE